MSVGLVDTVDSQPARVRVYNDNLFDTLMDPTEGTQGYASPSKSAASDAGHSRAGLTAALKKRDRVEKKKKLLDAEESRQRRYQRHREQSTRLQAESERQVRERLGAISLKREVKHQEHHGELQKGNQLVDEIGRTLALAEQNQRNKVRCGSETCCYQRLGRKPHRSSAHWGRSSVARGRTVG
jgi:hypothetical protein